MEEVVIPRKKVFILVALALIMGWLINDLYSAYIYQRSYNGLHIRPNRDMSYGEIKDLAETRDKYGNWICINVRNMKYEEVVDTCIHEAAHEVFARLIEESPEKMNKVFEVIENE